MNITHPRSAPAESQITGYRELFPDEIKLINEIKAEGRHLAALIAHMRNAKNIHLIDQRWVSTGETDLQKGLMALTRAVAQPSTF
jgi:hypothetical protein